MTQPGTTPKASAPAGNNIFTVLALVAALILLAGSGFVAYGNIQLTGQSNPFTVLDKGQLAQFK